MALSAYQKFLRHAMPYLRVARHTWTAKQREAAIITVFEMNPAVKEHYDVSDEDIPDLASLFPNDPLSPALDRVELRSHGLTPDAFRAMQVSSTRPSALPVSRQYTRFPARPALPASTGTQAAPPTHVVIDATTQTLDEPPYKHWPLYPWSADPDLPRIAASAHSLQAQELFLSTRPHLSEDEPHWHGAKILGRGSSGVAGLWCKIDEQGNVVDRMVVKDNVTFTRQAWRDPMNWRDQSPNEIAVMRRIEARRSAEPEACQYIIKYLGHRLYMKQRRFRLYTEFASGGSLTQVMAPLSEKWDETDSDRVASQDFLPEAFIWHMIKALATACVFLEDGTLHATPAGDWKPIFHLDLQTHNILLETSSKKRKATDESNADSEPTGTSKRLKSGNKHTYEDRELVPKLADFGFSFYDLDFHQCEDLDENPQDHILPYESTRYAPEHNHHNESLPETIDNKTDVWGIGRIAWCLIVNKLDTHGPVREDGVLDRLGNPLPISASSPTDMRADLDYDNVLLLGSNDWPAARYYSEKLKGLVRECLQYDKELRPSPRELLYAVNEHLEANPRLKEGTMDVRGTLLTLADNSGMDLGELLVVIGPSER